MALVRIQVRRDPAATWAAANPVLAAGEPGLETDTGKIKYGDGVRAWNSLPYSSGVSLGSSVPPAAGTAAAGTSQDAARADHSHALPTNLQAQTIQASGSASVGGTLTVNGALVGGTHRHNASDINDLAAAVFARIVSSIKAGSNIQTKVDNAELTLTISSSAAGSVPLSITQNPSDYTSTDGSAMFLATAIGGTGVIAYEWQVSVDGGAAWAAVPGANGTSLSLTGVTGAMDGNRYRMRATSGVESVTSSSATLRTATIAITSQPPDVSASVGESVRLAVSASAGTQAISYAWQRLPAGTTEWIDIAEAVLPVYQFVATSATEEGGDKYRAIATAGGQSATSREALVAITAPPVSFASQPVDTVDSSGAASFAAVVTGGAEPLAFRWQRLGGGSSTWAAGDARADIPDGTSGVSGQGSASLSLTGQGANQHLRQYRLKVTDDIARVAFSATATLRTLSLTITTQPSDVTAVDGDALASNAFSAAATADGGVTYQWQRSTNNGATWSNIAGATSATYGGFAVAFSDDGTLYRCAITGDGQTLNTSTASLTVAPPPLTISTHPSNATATGSTATFGFSHTGGPAVTAEVYWESRAVGGAWTRVSGATSTTLSVTGITPESNGTSYRGVVRRGAAIAFTNVATLTAPGAIIFLQPQDTTAANGAASFSVDFTSVACSSPTILWQQRISSTGSWSSAPGSNSGKTYSLSALTTASNGYQYRALVTCGGRQSESSAATLTVPVPPVVITTQPSDATAALGQAAFTFAFSGGNGSAPSIVWERALPGGAFAVVAGATTNTLAVSGVTSALSGAQYRATVTIGSQSATTRHAILTVSGALITLQPADAIAVQGSASFTMDFAATACQNAEIQWERKPTAGTVWEFVQGATSKTLSLTLLTPDDTNHQYRAGVSCGGSISYTSAATLTVPSYEFFSSQPGDQSVSEGDAVTFSYQGSFPASSFSARWQTRRIGQPFWSYYTPPTASQQSISFTARAAVHHNTEWRVEIAIPARSVIYSRVARLSVGKKTSVKTVNVAGTSELMGLAYARGSLVAVTSEQTPLVRRSVDDGNTWTTHFLPASRYWDGIVSTSTGALLAYSSGESGLLRINSNNQVAWELQAETGVMARSTDGGRTWSSLSLPFFFGSVARMWHLGRDNATIVVFRGETSSGNTSSTAWFDSPDPRRGSGTTFRRNGVLYMAVTFNDGTSWSIWEIRDPLPPFHNQGALHVTQPAISPSGILVLATRRYYRTSAAEWRERAGVLMYRNVAASWGPPAPATTSTVGVAGLPAQRYGVRPRGGVIPTEPRSSSYAGTRSAVRGVPLVAGTAVPNHEACSVAWVPGAGFIAASDTYQVAMISQDGNLWGPIPTDRVLGQLPLFSFGKDVWAVDTLLPRYEWICRGDASTYPDLRNTDMGVTEITDAVNCWAASSSALFLLEQGANITFIPRDDQGDVAPGTPPAPEITSAVARNNGVLLSWAAPPSSGSSAISGYRVQVSANFGSTWGDIINIPIGGGVSGAGGSVVIPNLTNGTQWVLRVAAANASGMGLWSNISAPITPSPQIPGAPSSVTAVIAGVAANGSAANATITVSWSPPATTGGSPITGYVVRIGTFVSARLTSPVTSVTLRFSDRTQIPLGMGTSRPVQFSVSAVNVAGEGPASELSAPVRVTSTG